MVINLCLYKSSTCRTFAITSTKLDTKPEVAILLTQDDAKLPESLKSSLKEQLVGINIYQKCRKNDNTTT